MITIPQQSTKQYSQPNTGDFFGNIRQSKNISFVRNGYVTLEKRTRNLLDSQTYTDLTASSAENIEKIAYLNPRIWLMGTKSLYYLDADLAITKDVAAGTPTLSTSGNDMCEFQAASGKILVVAYNTSTLKYWDGASWGTIATDVTNPNTLALFENMSSIAVGGANLVQLVDSTKTKSTLLTLPANYNVKSMDWNNNRLYIGTENSLGGDGMVFEWDGITAEANYGHPVKANKVLAVKRYKNGVAFVTSNGQLMKLEGTVSELANFPIYYSNKQWATDVNTVNYSERVLHGGMIVDRDMIFIAVDSTYSLTNADDTDEYFENDFPSGVWCYDPDVGLYHRYSVGGAMRTVTGAITTANVNTATGVITIPSSICPDTGTPVFYDDASDGTGTKITPLKFNTRYFVIKVTGSTLKLASSYQNALDGINIALTATGNNNQTLIFCPNSDFGGIYQAPRALYLLTQKDIQIPESSKAAKLLIGSLITKTTSTTYTGLHAAEFKQENRGYFIIPRVQSKEVGESFQKIIIKHRPLVNDDDKIVVKYRKVRHDQDQPKLTALSPTATWVNATSFTTSDVTDMAVGNEIEIVSGAGCGYLAHITNISAPSGGLYTVTIDETVFNIAAADTFQYVIDNWTKITPVTSTSTITNSEGYSEINLPINAKATAIELKIELRGEDVAIEEIQIISNINKKSE